MFDRGSLRWSIWNYFESALLIVSGLLCIVFSGNPNLQKWAVIALGILVVLDAAGRLAFGVITIVETKIGAVVAASFSKAVAGSFELAAGISIILIGAQMSNATAIFQFIGNFVGILLMVFGVMLSSYAIVYLIKKSQGKTLSLFELILAALFVTAGILCVVYLQNQSVVVQAALIAFGISILLLGLFLLASTTFILKVQRKGTKTANERIVEEKPVQPNPIDEKK
jgi:hypothetical protein